MDCADCGVRLCFCPTPRAHDSDGFNYNGAWLCCIHAVRRSNARTDAERAAVRLNR